MAATYVNEKGVNVRSVAIVKNFIEKLGHKKVTFKSDQERAILAMREEVKRHTLVAQTLPASLPSKISKLVVVPEVKLEPK